MAGRLKSRVEVRMSEAERTDMEAARRWLHKSRSDYIRDAIREKNERTFFSAHPATNRNDTPHTTDETGRPAHGPVAQSEA